jgi:chromosomal replication initiator protein
MTAVKRETARERYAHILIDRLEAMGELDDMLCDRIERVLRVPSVRRFKTKQLGIPEIVDVVAKRYGVQPEALTSDRRTQPEAMARQVAMRLIREMLGVSYPEIGRAFNRDHSTVIHAMEVTGGIAIEDIREELEGALA